VIREYICALTAVSPADGQVTSLVMPWVDTETMSVFLRHTARRFRGDLCVMLLDSAGWHRANAPSNHPSDSAATLQSGAQSGGTPLGLLARSAGPGTGLHERPGLAPNSSATVAVQVGIHRTRHVLHTEVDPQKIPYLLCLAPRVSDHVAIRHIHNSKVQLVVYP
jgi:hypothetical protein